MNFKRLYLDYGPKAMIENNELWYAKYREDILTNENIRRKGMEKQSTPFPYDPVKGWTQKITKKADIMDQAFIFGAESAMLISDKMLSIFQKLNMPKFQKWPAKVSYRNEILDYDLIYFYYDYFLDLDFSNCVFALYRSRKVKEPTYHAESAEVDCIDDNFKFTNAASMQEWYNKNIYCSTRPYAERLRLKTMKLQFQSEVYELDIIPSTGHGAGIICSENLINECYNERIKHVSFLDINSNIISFPD